VSQINTETIDQTIPDTSGTNIGDGIMRSIDALAKSGSGTKSIIVLTDGRANVGIDPIIAAQKAKMLNITLYTV
jgi:Mg-chelatase subunit ChlD